MPSKVLIVDDDPVQRDLLERLVTRSGHHAVTQESGRDALSYMLSVAGRDTDLVVLDLVMPDLDGMAVMERMRAHRINVPIIIQITPSSLDGVMTAMKAGASDFIVKPVGPERLAVSIANTLRHHRLQREVLRTDRGSGRPATLQDLATKDPTCLALLARCEKLAQTHAPILIEGETRSGKETLARAIHASSPRRERPFIVFDGARMTQSEGTSTFDHVFTAARGGTLFIKSVEALPPDLQRVLSKRLDEKSASANGTRIMASSSTNLVEAVTCGQLDESLFYRLTINPVRLPPLRARPRDMRDIVSGAALRLAAAQGKAIDDLSPDAFTYVSEQSWPGNYDELEQALASAIAVSTGPTLTRSDFLQALPVRPQAAKVTNIVQVNFARPVDEKPSAMLPCVGTNGHIKTLAEVEAMLLRLAYGFYHGQISAMTRHLGIGRSTLYRKLKTLGVEPASEGSTIGDAA